MVLHDKTRPPSYIVEPTEADGVLLFRGGMLSGLVVSVTKWVQEHPEVTILAVVPVIEDGKAVEYRVVTKV